MLSVRQSLCYILDVDIHFLDLHAYDMLKGSGDFFLDGGTHADDVGSHFYYEIEVSRDGILLYGQRNALVGYIVSQPAYPLVLRLGHPHYAWDLQRCVCNDG